MRKTIGRESWKEIKDTSWVQFRGFPQEVEWPVSVTIEVVQFLSEHSRLQRLARTPASICTSRGKSKGPYSTKDSLNDLVGSYYDCLTSPQIRYWHFTVSYDNGNQHSYQAHRKLLWSQPCLETLPVPSTFSFFFFFTFMSKTRFESTVKHAEWIITDAYNITDIFKGQHKSNWSKKRYHQGSLQAKTQINR